MEVCPAVRFYGDEIRPALPFVMPDPGFTRGTAGSEGNVVIEFTIDERGEIVRTSRDPKAWA